MKPRTPAGRALAKWFGARLRTIRGAHAMTQYDLAKAARLLRGAVAAYEAGRAMPSIEAVIWLARGLRVPPAFLIEGIDDVVAKATKAAQR